MVGQGKHVAEELGCWLEVTSNQQRRSRPPTGNQASKQPSKRRLGMQTLVSSEPRWSTRLCPVTKEGTEWRGMLG